MPEEPLLRAIAREIVERTHAVLALEERLAGLGRFRGQARRMEARLASHRKALRLIDRELWALGWTRDADRPLKFVRRGSDKAADESWKLSGTAFQRALELG
jgi:hypothetical protein